MANDTPESEPSFRELVETLQVGVVVHSPTLQIVFCNQRALDLLGLRKDQLLGRSFLEPEWSIVGQDGAPFPTHAHPPERALHEKCAIHDVVMGVRLPRTKARVWLMVHANPLFAPDGSVRQVVVTFSDITERQHAETVDLTERKRAEAKIRRLNDFYNVLAQCHAAIGRTNRLQVLNEICRIIVTVGGLDVASIGLLDPVNERIVPVASFADEERSDSTRGMSPPATITEQQGPAVRALRSGQAQWVETVASDADDTPPTEPRARHAWRSAGALPLFRGEVIAGVLELYSNKGVGIDLDVRGVLGDVAAAVGAALDGFARETARRRSEEELRDSEARFRAVCDDSLTGVFVLKDSRFAYANPAMEALLGYGAGELLGRDPMSCVHPEDRARATEHVDGRFAGESNSEPREYRGLRKDGTDFVMKILSAPTRIGRQPAVVANVVDVTAQKRAEEVLMESEARFRTLIEKAPVGINIMRGGKTLYVNQRYLEMFRVASRDEVVGHSLDEQWPTESRHQLMEQVFQRGLGLTPAVPFEAVALRRDGSRFPVDVSMDVLALPDGPSIVGFLTDITDLRRAEAELRASAEETRQLYARLASVEDDERRALHAELHDQVGANLSALRLALDVAATMLERNDDHLKALPHLTYAKQVATETITAARDLMAVLRPPALDDFGLVAALKTFAESQSSRISLPIRVLGEHLEPRPSPAVEDALFRIAREALSNAAQHASARHVDIRVDQRAAQVLITIEDDGVGFDPSAAGKLTDHWGLKNMRERARAVGGTLRIDSAPRSGTKISVEAPFKGI
jgi:PAS domain S-box-containing protein